MELSRNRRISALLVGLLCLVAATGVPPTTRADVGRCATRDVTDRAAVFPVSIAASKRHLHDASRRPFLIHGDTAWSLIAELTREEAAFYLSDRKARGFNTILVSLIEHRFSTNAPANAYDQNPFRIRGNFAMPNEAYFAHADWVLRRAREHGFLVLLAPAYTGHGGGQEGWYEEMVASGSDKLRAYGRFLGERYSTFDNIIWAHAGDYNPPDRSLVRAIVEGIIETAPAMLHTAHGSRETAAIDYWTREPWLALNTIYTYGRVHAAASKQHGGGPQMPFFLIESAYENEHGATEQRLRLQAYDAIFSGAAGHVFGNNPIWHFGGPGLYPAAVHWKQALGSRGTQSMCHLRKLMDYLAWWALEPANGLIINNRNPSLKPVHERLISWSMREHAVSAIARDGSFAVVYLPSVRDIAVNLAQLGGNNVTARWFDPSDGSFIRDSVVSRDGIHIYRPPGQNRAGFGDWVLLLRSGS